MQSVAGIHQLLVIGLNSSPLQLQLQLLLLLGRMATVVGPASHYAHCSWQLSLPVSFCVWASRRREPRGTGILVGISEIGFFDQNVHKSSSEAELDRECFKPFLLGVHDLRRGRGIITFCVCTTLDSSTFLDTVS